MGRVTKLYKGSARNTSEGSGKKHRPDISVISEHLAQQRAAKNKARRRLPRRGASKRTLVKRLAATEAFNGKAAAKRFLDGFIEAVTEALVGGDDIALRGFGVFSTAERKPRTWRNPGTGREIRLPAGRLPRFKPGKGLKEKANPVR